MCPKWTRPFHKDAMGNQSVKQMQNMDKIYFSHLLPDEEMRDIIRKTGMGIESIEFSIADNLDQLQQTLITYEKRLEYMECRSLTLHGPFLDLNPMAFDREIRQVTMRRYEQSYQAAKILHAKKLVFHSCYIPQVYLNIGLEERMADFYDEFLQDKDDSVQIVMENVLDPSPDVMKKAACLISNKIFGLCLDIGHANCYSDLPPIRWVQEMAPFINHIHLHKNNGKKDSHGSLKCGNIASEQILEWLMKDPTEKTYTIECNSAQEVVESWELCRNILDRE